IVGTGGQSVGDTPNRNARGEENEDRSTTARLRAKPVGVAAGPDPGERGSKDQALAHALHPLPRTHSAEFRGTRSRLTQLGSIRAVRPKRQGGSPRLRHAPRNGLLSHRL